MSDFLIMCEILYENHYERAIKTGCLIFVIAAMISCIFIFDEPPEIPYRLVHNNISGQYGIEKAVDGIWGWRWSPYLYPIKRNCTINITEEQAQATFKELLESGKLPYTPKIERDRIEAIKKGWKL